MLLVLHTESVIIFVKSCNECILEVFEIYTKKVGKISTPECIVGKNEGASTRSRR